MRHRLRLSLICLVGATVSVLLSASIASAYNGSAAANYADQYWYYYNNTHYPTLAEDCTNFASQGLNAGGFPQRGYPNTSDQNWWIHTVSTNLYSISPAWDNASNLRDFLVNYAYSPGGYDQGSYLPASGMYSWANDNLSKGDIIFYDWTNDGTYDHTSIQTSYGTDPSYTSYYGSLVDTHGSDRYHEIWTLYPTNTQYRNTTKIDLVHIM